MNNQVKNKEIGKGKKILKKFFKRGAIIVGYVIALNVAQQLHVFASDDPLTVINNLSDFIFGLIRAVGMIILGFGVVQVGMSLKSHDPTQRANALSQSDFSRRYCNYFLKRNIEFNYRWLNMAD